MSAPSLALAIAPPIGAAAAAPKRGPVARAEEGTDFAAALENAATDQPAAAATTTPRGKPAPSTSDASAVDVDTDPAHATADTPIAPDTPPPTPTPTPTPLIFVTAAVTPTLEVSPAPDPGSNGIELDRPQPSAALVPLRPTLAPEPGTAPLSTTTAPEALPPTLPPAQASTNDNQDTLAAPPVAQGSPALPAAFATMAASLLRRPEVAPTATRSEPEPADATETPASDAGSTPNVGVEPTIAVASSPSNTLPALLQDQAAKPAPLPRDIVANAANVRTKGDGVEMSKDAAATPAVDADPLAVSEATTPASAPASSNRAVSVAAEAPPSAPTAPDPGEPTPPAQAAETARIESRVAEASTLALSTTSRASIETTAQIAAQIVRKLESRSTRFEMALTPDDLGRVDVSLDIDADGQLAARLAFDNPVAATELRGRVDELRRQLQEAGFTVADDALSFAQRDPSGDQGGAFDRGNGARNARAFGAASRLSADADLAAAPARWIPLTLTPERVDMKV